MSDGHITSTPLDLSNPNHEYCLFSVRIVNRVRKVYSCVRCFCNTGLANRVQSFEIFITHHITNGPYSPSLCVFCRKDLIRKRRAVNCPRCLDSYIIVSNHFRVQDIDIRKIHFLFDIFNNKFEYVGPIHKVQPTDCQPNNTT